MVFKTIRPIFWYRPDFDVGMPVLRAKFRFAAVMPKNVFQLNPPLFIFFSTSNRKGGLTAARDKSFLKSKSDAMCNHVLAHL